MSACLTLAFSCVALRTHLHQQPDCSTWPIRHLFSSIFPSEVPKRLSPVDFEQFTTTVTRMRLARYMFMGASYHPCLFQPHSGIYPGHTRVSILGYIPRCPQSMYPAKNTLDMIVLTPRYLSHQYRARAWWDWSQSPADGRSRHRMRPTIAPPSATLPGKFRCIRIYCITVPPLKLARTCKKSDTVLRTIRQSANKPLPPPPPPNTKNGDTARVLVSTRTCKKLDSTTTTKNKKTPKDYVHKNIHCPRNLARRGVPDSKGHLSGAATAWFLPNTAAAAAATRAVM